MMDMGQITQGLRTDILQQAAGQGINVAQMMEAGVSFADIMLLILQNTQSIANGQGIPMPQNLQQTAQMPMTDMPQMAQQSVEMTNQNEMSFMPDMKNLMPNMLNIQNNAENEMAGMLNSVQMPNGDAELNMTGAEVTTGASQNEDTVAVTENSDVEVKSENIENSDIALKSDFIDKNNLNADNIQINLNHENTQINQNTVNVNQNLQNDFDVTDADVLNNGKSEFVNITDNTKKPIIFNALNENAVMSGTQIVTDTDCKAVMPQVNEIVNNAEMPVIENIWHMAADTPLTTVADNQVHSPKLHNAEAYNVTNSDVNSLAQKLSEVVGLISPEFVNASESNSSMMNNNFVMDLISELSTEGEIKDSFDMSESMLKIDPMQLAGLLDFISTGNGIPQAMDVSDSEMFKNLDTINNVKASAEKVFFDPQEMLRTGEMEIVSYTPAPKNNNSQQQSKQNDESTIDLARTMKSVRENVKTEANDDTVNFSDITASMTASNPDEIAQKVDISFERAYAELEMNKAKYGSADRQLYKGISENLERGRSEFTVKLRPEGLGEILVKLVSDEGGKAVLTLVASSEKTAELLNRDLASLQTSLNQHNVEIENNSVKTAETVMNAQTAFDQYNERQQDEARQQHHFRQLKERMGEISDKNASFDSETETVINTASDSALNITI